MAFYDKYGTIKLNYGNFMHKNIVLELHVDHWTFSQPNSKIFMVVVCLVSFHKIHIWRFMISKFLLWWSTRKICLRAYVMESDDKETILSPRIGRTSLSLSCTQ